jgi:hypothetical protein
MLKLSGNGNECKPLGLGELRAYYEEEVDRLNSQVARLKSDADARVVVLAAGAYTRPIFSSM